ncbi:MAG: sugar phosphate nucleotidyltransferase [Lachnospiraceae bacterium]|nr:sugar phosphate nucleotidyltransferase [Lachnospiraceae bacterium]
MDKPVLVIMAAGMGSRYGGMKQIDPIDEQGHIIMDYSLFDARRAGFEKVILIIKKENEEAFREGIGGRIAEKMQVEYAFQNLDDLPEGYQVPEERVKPWGTGHAVRSARHLLNGPFAVINADDYYGPEAFKLIYDYLAGEECADEEKVRCAMVAYILKNTVTESGHVARGVCSVNEEGYLQTITERTKIIKTETGTAFSEDDGQTWTEISPESPVSMNMWGFPAGFMKELDQRFGAFLDQTLESNPLKGEYFLPFVVDELLQEGRATARVLQTPDRWYGMTYKEDKKMVESAMQDLKKQGVYPVEF